jgi:PadR family transcriptional regulator, regulatory protein PadR
MAQAKPNLLQGTLTMLILRVLANGELHGYEIAHRIQQLSDDVLKVEEGSLYPALYRLEEAGWIEAEWGASENNRRAKYYSLTKAGRKQLVAETNNWERLSDAIIKVMQTA